MPRGRCHFALLLALLDRLKEQMPGVGELARAHFPNFLAGSLAPDAMRSLGRMGKFRSHFYAEDRPETWGKSVSGMFETHPALSNPSDLSDENTAFILGYISHLTTDEAFRDEVTIYVHGTEDWRPIIRGLWSLIDELAISYRDLGGEIDKFDRSDSLDFIDFGIAKTFLQRARGWAVETDPWCHEMVFLRMIDRAIPEEEAKAAFLQNRKLAAPYLNEERRANFVRDALKRGSDEIRKFVEKAYVRDPG
jgi:hypothetical protein